MNDKYVTLDGERIDGENVESFGHRGELGFVTHRITAGDDYDRRQLRAIQRGFPFESSATIDGRGFTQTVTEYGDVQAFGYVSTRLWINV